MDEQGGWNMLCKFFDNLGPIPHHMHQSDKHASLVGQTRQAGGLLLPAAIQPSREQLSIYLHGP